MSIPDNESIHSAFAYSRAPTAPGSSTRGDVGYSAASDIWDDINQAEDSCLDQGVIHLGANMDDGMGCLSELQFNLTGQTGSYIYMAPEMFKGLPYNEKVRGVGGANYYIFLHPFEMSTGNGVSRAADEGS